MCSTCHVAPRLSTVSRGCLTVVVGIHVPTKSLPQICGAFFGKPCSSASGAASRKARLLSTNSSFLSMNLTAVSAIRLCATSSTSFSCTTPYPLPPNQCSHANMSRLGLASLATRGPFASDASTGFPLCRGCSLDPSSLDPLLWLMRHIESPNLGERQLTYNDEISQSLQNDKWYRLAHITPWTLDVITTCVWYVRVRVSFSKPKAVTNCAFHPPSERTDQGGLGHLGHLAFDLGLQCLQCLRDDRDLGSAVEKYVNVRSRVPRDSRGL